MSLILDDRLLELLLREAEKSTCDKIRFGAVALWPDGGAISWGHNHHPRRPGGWSCMTHCVGGIRKGVASGTCVERCYSVHAEQHAILNARGIHPFEIAVAGILPDGSLFDNGGGFYCTVCARIMAVADVRYVSIWSRGKRVRLTMAEAWDQSYRIATQ